MYAIRSYYALPGHQHPGRSSADHQFVLLARLSVDLSLAENLLEMDVDYMMVPKVDGIKLQLRELEQRGFLNP